MKSLIIYINEGNQAHKLVEFAKKFQKKWNSELKQKQKDYENSIKDKELMEKDYDKYLDNQFQKMDEFNNKMNELVDNPEVAMSALLYQISFLKNTQTNLFKYGLKYIQHLIDLKKNNNYDGNIKNYISELSNKTIENTEKTINGLNQTIKDIKNNNIHSLHDILDDNSLKIFVDKYKLIGIKYTDKFEIYDKSLIFKLFIKKSKEYIENQKENNKI